MGNPFIIFLSCVGTLSAIAVNLTPFPSLLKAQQSKNLQEISHMFLILANINALSWVLYSLRAQITSLLIPNSINFTTTLIFIIWYHLLKKDLLKFSIGLLIFQISLIGLGLKLVPLTVIAFTAVVSNFLGYAAPIQQLQMVFAEKNSKYIDIYILFGCIICSSVWLVFGVFTSNLYVVVPNTGGLIVCIFQLMVFLWAREAIPHWTFGMFQSVLGLYNKESKPLKEKVGI